jgi:hypothetical protein
MGFLKKALLSTTGLGVLALVGSQALGTATGVYYFNHLSEMSMEQQTKVSELNTKISSNLNNPKYQEFLADPYFDSSEFTSKSAFYKEGDKAYDDALAETTKSLKETIVDRYPLTASAFSQMKNTTTSHLVIDMDSFGKWQLAKNAEDSCDLNKKVADEQAIAFGKKYFCP